jgi:general secretion pathway protein H
LPIKRRQPGFTLVEVLVVLLVVGLVGAGASLGLEAWHSRDRAAALQRLRLVLEATAERATVRGQRLALELLPDGYRFQRYDTDGHWRPLHEPPLFVERRLPAPLAWRELKVDGQTPLEPTLLIFRSRPPEFALSIDDAGQLAVLRGSATGAVTLQAGAAP